MHASTWFDHLLFALLLLAPLFEWRWSWPRYLARLAAGVPGVRAAHYRTVMLGEWIPALALLVYWRLRSRSFGALYFTAAFSLRLWIGFACVLALIAFLLLQHRAVLTRPSAFERMRKAMAYGEPLLPHTSGERRLFWALSITAGVCEELLYRGFLVWYLSNALPLVAAIVVSAVIFGIGHVYLGPAQVPRTASVGLVLSGLVWLAGSLWPAILLHAATDWNSGEMGFRLLATSQPDASQQPAST